MRLSVCFALFVASLAASFGAAAQLRTIPDEAKRGVIRHVHEMTVELNGVTQNLAPGAQIRNESNLIIVPTALPPESRVKFLLDIEGRISRVWILTASEAAQPDARK